MTLGFSNNGLSDQERRAFGESLEKALVSAWPREHARVRYSDADKIGEAWARLVLDQQILTVGVEVGGVREAALVAASLGYASCPAPFIGSYACRQALQVDTEAGIAIAFDDRLNTVDHLGASRLLVLGDADASLWTPSQIEFVPEPAFGEPWLASVRFNGEPDERRRLDAEFLTDLRLRLRLLLMSRALGAAQRSFELAVEHAKQREQFGQPIGRFQALQHKFANAFIDLDGSRLTLEHAAAAIDANETNWRGFALAALAFASPALRRVANECHHALGAIGYSEEHEATLHFRRVHIDALLLGKPNEARLELASWAGARGGLLPEYALGADAKRFRDEVRAWFESNWCGPAKQAHDMRPFRERGFDRGLSRALGAQGWLGLSWPRSAGGEARSPLERLAFVEEAAAVDAPLSAHSAAATLVGPALIAFGGEELKADLLPRILRGEITACLGYSEPGAGSDLAALRTRAERTEAGWMINGQKLWMTYGEKADYVLLAARTNSEGKKHEGITLFLVSMQSPGIEVRPSLALYGRTFCTVFYDAVQVPDTARVGEVDGGWTVLTSALSDERILMGASILQARILLSRLVLSLRGAGEADRAELGGLLADAEVARQLLTRSIGADHASPHQAAMTKVFSSEFMQRLSERALELLGPSAVLSENASAAPIDGAFEQFLRYSIMHVIGGGANEIQRTLIAQRGLGLPR